MYKLLLNREILKILDGDAFFGFVKIKGEETLIKLAMPYLTGPQICNVSKMFGFDVEYGKGGLSRWAYMENLLKDCIENNQVSNLLVYLFSKKQFINDLKTLDPNEIDIAYAQIVEEIIKQINKILYFSQSELRIQGCNYQIVGIGGSVNVDTPNVKTIDREYIKDITNRAMIDISNNNFDSAITKSRTLLEEVFIYVIEKKHGNPTESGNIGLLYKEVKTLYKMHANQKTDQRINMLLSGLEKIISAIAEMRNKGSDAHGLGAKRINISEYHARLFVNSAVTMVLGGVKK